MLTIMESHNEAMELADEADLLRRKGETEAARALYARAFELEKQSAMKVADRDQVEPTRSILFRSAASLAIEAGLLRDAEIMIAIGLSGNPPDERAHPG